MGLILSNSPEPAQQDLSLVPRRKQWHQLGVFSHPCLRAEALGATGMRLPEAMLLEEHRCAKGRGRRAARRCAQQLVSALVLLALFSAMVQFTAAHSAAGP